MTNPLTGKEKELIDNMKLCPLCLDNSDWPYTEINAQLHGEQGLHFYLGKTYAPTKGHEDFDLSQRMLDIFSGNLKSYEKR